MPEPTLSLLDRDVVDATNYLTATYGPASARIIVEYLTMLRRDYHNTPRRGAARARKFLDMLSQD